MPKFAMNLSYLQVRSCVACDNNCEASYFKVLLLNLSANFKNLGAKLVICGLN